MNLKIANEDIMLNINKKNKIYVGLCIIYISLSMINRKYPIGDIVLNVAYLSTWGSIFLWEIINILTGKKKNYDSVIIVLVILIISIMSMMR